MTTTLEDLESLRYAKLPVGISSTKFNVFCTWWIQAPHRHDDFAFPFSNASPPCVCLSVHASMQAGGSTTHPPEQPLPHGEFSLPYNDSERDDRVVRAVPGWARYLGGTESSRQN